MAETTGDSSSRLSSFDSSYISATWHCPSSLSCATAADQKPRFSPSSNPPSPSPCPFTLASASGAFLQNSLFAASGPSPAFCSSPSFSASRSSAPAEARGWNERNQMPSSIPNYPLTQNGQNEYRETACSHLLSTPSSLSPFLSQSPPISPRHSDLSPFSASHSYSGLAFVRETVPVSIAGRLLRLSCTGALSFSLPSSPSPDSCSSSSLHSTTLCSPSSPSPPSSVDLNTLCPFSPVSESASTADANCATKCSPELSRVREVSSIPKTALTDDSGGLCSACPASSSASTYREREEASPWLYPSPQQFYNALLRRNKNVEAEFMDATVRAHNEVNERSWKEIKKWEEAHIRECASPTLTRFVGRSDDLSPKGFWRTYFSVLGRPFDRHDWFIDRCGKTVRYILDFYDDASADDDLQVFLDCRPALDSFESLRDRVRHPLFRWRQRLLRSTTSPHTVLPSAELSSAGVSFSEAAPPSDSSSSSSSGSD